MGAVGPDVYAAFTGKPRPGDEFPLNATSDQYRNVLRVNSGSGYLFGFTVYSSRVSPQFVLVFDAGAVPADGATAVLVFTVPAASDKAIEWLRPRWFSQGIIICNSSTAPTKTIGANDCFFDAQYV